ncbi:MAG: rhodanese-like domain-containing protein, partial [Opitutaceae bacterium]
AGVLGALCGVIGSMQALEAIKILTGIGDSLRGRLLTYDALAQQVQTLQLPRNPGCPLCGASPAIHELTAKRYESAACDAAPSSFVMPDEFPLELSVAEVKRRREAAPDRTQIIDVREPYELEICRIEGAEHIPMRQIPERVETLSRDKHLMILCHSGERSRHVAEFLRARGFDAVSNISGGIDAWAEAFDPAMRRY